MISRSFPFNKSFTFTDLFFYFFFSSRRRHTSLQGDWSSDVCSSDLSTQRSEFVPNCGENRPVIVREVKAERFRPVVGSWQIVIIQIDPAHSGNFDCWC